MVEYLKYKDWISEQMEIREFGNSAQVAITMMRKPGEFGLDESELSDGNTIPRLCLAVGSEACSQACQLESQDRTVACAEFNILNAISQFETTPERFLMVSATADNVIFGDDMEEAKVTNEGYGVLPNCNAFFYMPGIDKGPTGQEIDTIAMRMADCGSVNVQFSDWEGNIVLGQVHFSKPNMKGPSAFIHELDGVKVSWGEYVFTKALEYYSADPASVKIYLAAAVDRDDFVFNFSDIDKMNENFTGWDELGFVHPQGSEDFDCLVDYREMIAWQINQAVEKLGINSENVELDSAINTGDLSLGHASHHWGRKGVTAEGRDLYLIGSKPSFRS